MLKNERLILTDLLEEMNLYSVPGRGDVTNKFMASFREHRRRLLYKLEGKKT